ncbi:P-loop containing nucleoside triphosphate hydrolase protein [Epithele typhae]|uniref:P-loop containing nucleoside triphosphate hydrolase protein n=1 Tax=Epithele typhae TaxID=378194 RepID=UPI0020076B1B|nr:P-loop containing nucleoside triphosphate hydrolase protein [Epithele typhae]KAH9912109.1 P-loop containing nucleoside triphosphate hydrolase protein [Epithele typhae]
MPIYHHTALFLRCAVELHLAGKDLWKDFPTWRERASTPAPPWSDEYTLEELDVDDEEEHEAIRKLFATAVERKTVPPRVSKSDPAMDTAPLGGWVTRRWNKDWTLRKTTEDLLEEFGITIKSAIHKDRIPHSVSLMGPVRTPLVRVLFGEEGMVANGLMPLKALEHFAGGVVSILFEQWNSDLRRHIDKVDKLRKLTSKTHEKIVSGEHVTAAALQNYIKDMHALKKHLEPFVGEGEYSELRVETNKTLSDAHECLEHDVRAACFDAPKAASWLGEAILHLPSPSETAAIKDQMDRIVCEEITADHVGTMLTEDELLDWRSGCEEYEDCNVEEIRWAIGWPADPNAHAPLRLVVRAEALAASKLNRAAEAAAAANAAAEEANALHLAAPEDTDAATLAHEASQAASKANEAKALAAAAAEAARVAMAESRFRPNTSATTEALPAVRNGAMPYFAHFIDVKREFTEASGAKWEQLKKVPDRVQPLTLLWHQYGGVISILDRLFRGNPAMLCDDVGLGKTIQAVATMCYLDFAHQHHEKHGKWPGQFGSDPEKYKLEPIASRVHVVVVPNSLSAQWRSELERVLLPQSVIVLPYEGTSKDTSRAPVFEVLRRARGGMVILVVSATALTHDLVTACPSVRDWQSSNLVLKFRETYTANTLFRADFTPASLFIDEMHDYRKPGRAFHAVRGLSEKTKLIVGMSATPVVTEPADLCNQAILLRVPWMDHAVKDALHRAYTSAMRKGGGARGDRLKVASDALRNRISNVEAKRQAKSGSGSGVATPSSSQRDPTPMDVDLPAKIRRARDKAHAAHKALSAARSAYVNFGRQVLTGVVIHRTASTTDPEGNVIVSLAPYHEQFLVLQLSANELDVVKSLTKLIVVGGQGGRTLDGFYRESRVACFHPRLMGPNRIEPPAAYIDGESSKIEMIFKLMQYHQAERGLGPAMIDPDESAAPNTLIPRLDVERPNGSYTMRPEMPSDKSVLMMMTPMHSWLLTDMLKRRHIEYIEYTGKESANIRKARLKEFETSKTCNLLIISPVGITGLNLWFARILIIVEPLWSALEDRQLIGRVSRYMQHDWVIVYRLIAGEGIDPILAQISCSKSAMHETFFKQSELSDEVRKALDIVADSEMLQDPDVEREAAAIREGDTGNLDTQIDDSAKRAGTSANKGRKKTTASSSKQHVTGAGPSSAAADAKRAKGKKKTAQDKLAEAQAKEAQAQAKEAAAQAKRAASLAKKAKAEARQAISQAEIMEARAEREKAETAKSQAIAMKAISAIAPKPPKAGPKPRPVAKAPRADKGKGKGKATEVPSPHDSDSGMDQAPAPTPAAVSTVHVSERDASSAPAMSAGPSISAIRPGPTTPALARAASLG